ncbi:hypothetical protein [Nocardia gipuzkoensis]|uniref:hypothetical protein n=1 Tax=Nocardia gipuzkoensis TaxID=2749991 RepID=UPI003EE1D382
MGTELLVALLAGPITAGLVTAIGILEQRRVARDIEMRRKRLISAAHDQLAAVQIWESMKNASGKDSPAFSEKAEFIIESALNSILHAQTLPQQHAPIRERRDTRSPVWLIGRIDTNGAKVLRIFYYLTIGWTALELAVITDSIVNKSYGDVVPNLAAFIAVCLVPLFFFRWATLKYDHYRKNAIANKRREDPQRPIQPLPDPPPRPPHYPAGWYPPPVPGAGMNRMES